MYGYWGKLTAECCAVGDPQDRREEGRELAPSLHLGHAGETAALLCPQIAEEGLQLGVGLHRHVRQVVELHVGLRVVGERIPHVEHIVPVGMDGERLTVHEPARREVVEGRGLVERVRLHRRPHEVSERTDVRREGLVDDATGRDQRGLCAAVDGERDLAVGLEEHAERVVLGQAPLEGQDDGLHHEVGAPEVRAAFVVVGVGGLTHWLAMRQCQPSAGVNTSWAEGSCPVCTHTARSRPVSRSTA